MTTEIHSNSLKIKDLAGRYQNPATGKAYTDRTIRHWCEDKDKMNFPVIDSAVTGLQAELIEDYYRDVVVGKSPVAVFLEYNADRLEGARNQSRQASSARQVKFQETSDEISGEINQDDAEDAVFGALAPIASGIQSELAAIDQVCTQFEDMAVRAIVNRCEQVPDNIIKKAVKRLDKTQVKRRSLLGAVGEAFLLPSAQHDAMDYAKANAAI